MPFNCHKTWEDNLKDLQTVNSKYVNSVVVKFHPLITTIEQAQINQKNDLEKGIYFQQDKKNTAYSAWRNNRKL